VPITCPQIYLLFTVRIAYLLFKSVMRSIFTIQQNPIRGLCNHTTRKAPTLNPPCAPMVKPYSFTTPPSRQSTSLIPSNHRSQSATLPLHSVIVRTFTVVTIISTSAPLPPGSHSQPRTTVQRQCAQLLIRYILLASLCTHCHNTIPFSLRRSQCRLKSLVCSTA